MDWIQSNVRNEFEKNIIIGELRAMMQKNEVAVVTIEDIGVNGEGIGKVDGYT
jgi:hypothetical protein